MVSKSVDVEQLTHTASVGFEVNPKAFLLSYIGSFRSFKSETPTPEAFYDTAEHPIKGVDLSDRVIFHGDEFLFGKISQNQKIAHTVKIQTDIGKNKIMGSFTNSQAKNISEGIELKSNHGTLKYMVSPSLKTKIIALASLSKIENDSVIVDYIPGWRGGEPDQFDFTRYSNLTRTVGKGSAEFIYQPKRKYRLSFLAGYEQIKRDDYPAPGSDSKTTKLKFSIKGKYRPNLKFTGRFKYFFENVKDPSPYNLVFEKPGKTASSLSYYEREELRYGQITNQPTMLNGLDLSLNFKLNRKANFSFGLRTSLETNSDTDTLDFERTKLQPNLSLNFAPTPKWNLFTNLSYIYNKSNGLAAVAMMDGWGGIVGTTVSGVVKHYGSFFAETEYKNEAVSFSASIFFLATEKINFTLSGSFIDSKGTMNIIRMSDVPAEVTNNIAPANYDYSSINQYSDLAYTQYNLSLGTEYKISERVSFTADAVYFDLTDDEGYVYGTETGSLYIIRSGFRIGF